MKRTPAISEIEMRETKLDKANVTRANLDRAKEIETIVAAFDDEAAGKRAAGYYLYKVVSWLLDGLDDTPSIDSLTTSLSVSVPSAGALYGMLAGAREQIATTRSYCIAGTKSSGNRRPKKQPVICPDIDDDDIPDDMRVPGGLFL